MIHLGTRVSALLDGQLPAAEAERAWAHVHSCHVCRDLVEREGWIKTRLSGLSDGAGAAPDYLKGSLRCGAPMPSASGATAYDDRPRRIGIALLGGSAAGAAVIGVLALGVGVPNAPAPSRQPPVSNLGGSTETPRQVPGMVLRQSQPTRR